MLFRPTRVVRVTSKEELDSALASADQVIVEGDDQLLSYAAAKASHEPQLSSVVIEIGRHSISVGANVAGSAVVTGDNNKISNTWAEYAKKKPPPLPSPFPSRSTAWWSARKSSGFRLLLGLFIAFALLAPLSLWYFASPAVLINANSAISTPGSTPGPQSPAVTGTQGDITISRPPNPPSTLPNSSSTPQVLQSLAWPAVAIVAIVALFFIARQAIAGGRNVEISWKVTEKVTGRVVITKVRSRAKAARSAA